ncbi:hypothetical protein BKA57DRAFT_451604 [Linnemannia elongata]|nr:hypothetical protein BKA57DRAFT_451604 [Linnemannia elongata]
MLYKQYFVFLGSIHGSFGYVVRPSSLSRPISRTATVLSFALSAQSTSINAILLNTHTHVSWLSSSFLFLFCLLHIHVSSLSIQTLPPILPIHHPHPRYSPSSRTHVSSQDLESGVLFRSSDRLVSFRSSVKKITFASTTFTMHFLHRILCFMVLAFSVFCLSLLFCLWMLMLRPLGPSLSLTISLLSLLTLILSSPPMTPFPSYQLAPQCVLRIQHIHPILTI